MGANSLIEWTDYSFAPWFGCTKVSTGERGACAHCYAENMSVNRFHKVEGFGTGIPRVQSAASTWKQPLAWNRKAEREQTRPFVFCSHLSDAFDNEVDPQWRSDLFDLIHATPNLVWLLLTKRPQNIERLWFKAHGSTPWPSNAAIGCTVVTQAEADRDIIHLLTAKHRLDPAFAFLSMEPLMGPVDLEYPASIWPSGPPRCCNGFECGCMGKPVDPPLLWGIDWIITGGETDQGAHRARPSHPDWFRSIRDQCAATGVAYNHKQNGEWVAYGQHNGRPGENLGLPGPPRDEVEIDGEWMFKVGKRAAGRTLDGVTHDARPAVR